MITSAAHVAVTPAGKPVATPIPVAPVVVCVILVITVLIHNNGVEDGADTALLTTTVTGIETELLGQPFKVYITE